MHYGNLGLFGGGIRNKDGRVWIFNKFRLPRSRKVRFICFNESPLENERCFLFHLKRCFRSQDILICLDFFGLVVFWSLVLYGLLRKLRLIQKFMMSSLGKQITAIQVLPNISRSKVNQTMKFNQLIEYKVRNISLHKSCRK